MGDVAELTIGYRVPEPILTIANRLLPLTGVDASASRSVRVEGHAPTWVHTAARRVADGGGRRGADRLKHRHRLTGVVAPIELHAGDRRRARRRPGCTPSTISTNCTTARSRCSGPSR